MSVGPAITVTLLTPQQMMALQRLSLLGIFGDKPEDVAQYLITRGIIDNWDVLERSYKPASGRG
jgi:hypothetical protein